MHQNKLYIVMYHYVRDLKNNRYPKIKGLDFELFIQQIKYLKENSNIITMEQVINSYENHIALPENATLLTFDDGYIEHYTNVFPVLMEEKIQGSFFIPGKTFSEHKLLDVNKIHFILASADIQSLKSDLLEEMDYYRGNEFQYPSNKELYEDYAKSNRFDDKDTVFVKTMLQVVFPEKLRNIITKNLFNKYVGMSEDTFAHELYLQRHQIKCMRTAGMFIGLHGYDHYWLGHLNKLQMQADIAKAKDVMSEFIDKNAWVMNYPYGNYNNDVIDFLENNGCKLGLTTEVRVADLESDSRYTIPRLDTNDFPPKSKNYLNL